MMKTLSRFTAAILALSALAACAYRGGDIGDPVVRKFHWFSFVEGEDIRASCRQGTPDRYRVVYNGIYHEQLRIYELDSLRRILIVNVTGDADASTIDPEDPAGPWRAHEARIPLDDQSYRRLTGDFAAAGMFGPPATGLALPARSYFWTAAFCRDGRYGFTAWKHPSPAFDALAFDDILFTLDTTGVPVRPAGPVPFDPQWEDRARHNEVADFTLKVGTNGLVK